MVSTYTCLLVTTLHGDHYQYLLKVAVKFDTEDLESTGIYDIYSIRGRNWLTSKLAPYLLGRGIVQIEPLSGVELL